MITRNSLFGNRVFALAAGLCLSLSLGSLAWGETSDAQALVAQTKDTATDIMSHGTKDSSKKEELSTPKQIDIPDEELSSPAVTSSNEVFNERLIELTPRSSYVIHLPHNASQVLLTDPKVADVHLAGPTKLYVYGRSPGRTEVIVSTHDGQDTYRYPILVTSDFAELRQLIKRVAPNDTINVVSLPDGVLLEGTVVNAKTAEDLRILAQRFVGEKGNVLNQLTTKSANQINLHVKVAEVQRTALNQMGINWGAATKTLNNHFRFGLLAGRAPIIDAAGNFVPSTQTSPQLNSLGARFVDKNNNVASLLDVLAQESLATILAEPNLITRSGEEASFLVGGEFPYPIAQGTGASASITIQFKQYGISLSFLPVVLGDKISLRVRVEVSELDKTNSTKDLSGNTIPALTTRRAESTMEMGDGQGMMMAGLLSDQTSAEIDSIPGLDKIPILGPLFRSTDFKNDKTELVITVTPYIIEPVNQPQNIRLPTQDIKFATPEERMILGTLEKSNLLTTQSTESTKSTEPSLKLAGEAGFYY